MDLMVALDFGGSLSDGFRMIWSKVKVRKSGFMPVVSLVQAITKR